MKAGTSYFVPCHLPTSKRNQHRSRLSKYMLNEHRQTGIKIDQLLFDSCMLKSKMKEHRNGVIKIALIAMGAPIS